MFCMIRWFAIRAMGYLGAVLFVVFAFLIFAAVYALARDAGQWENSDPATKLWFQQLKQPDNGMSCCGEGDGYYADEVTVVGDKVYAIITDDRDDAPLGRLHVPLGMKFLVPNEKVVDSTRQHGNPTGHSIVFLGGGVNWGSTASNPEGRPVLCYIPGTGS